MPTLSASARKGFARPQSPNSTEPLSVPLSLEENLLWTMLSGTHTTTTEHTPRHLPLQRLFDVVASALLLMILAPLFLFIWLRLLQTGIAPIYRQTRIGYQGKLFVCLKFSTMYPSSDDLLRRYLRNNPIARLQWETYRKLHNDPRITPFGRFLRRTSFDELPQLWNVLRGQMSLVGPRPVPSYESELYGNALPVYQSVRPGITGLWQVSGRNTLAYRQRVMLDILYIRNRTLWLDLVILIKTIGVVRRGSGAW